MSRANHPSNVKLNAQSIGHNRVSVNASIDEKADNDNWEHDANN
jgi:hypothetical protein